MEERIANLEKKVLAIETKLTDLEKNMADKHTHIEGKIETVDNKVAGPNTAFIEGFNELKDVLLEIKQENTKVSRKTPSGDRESIIVASGYGVDSVEIFNWGEKTWSPLQSIPQQRRGATSFVYNNYVTIAGSQNIDKYLKDMISLNAESKSVNPSTPWTDCPIKMPKKMAYHASDLYKDQLLVCGGHDKKLGETSDCIYAVQLVPPYNVNILSRMSEPRRQHSMQIFEDCVVILGGTTTGNCEDSLSSVERYDLKKNESQKLAPLPFEICRMASVKYGDNIVVVGGCNKHWEALDTVILYNIKKEKSHFLPPMKSKRSGCTAVVSGNYIVVLGGFSKVGPLKSVEAFNFESNTWEELPEMSEPRYLSAAVAV